MFPPTGASVHHNEAGEPIGWDVNREDDAPYVPFEDQDWPDDEDEDLDCLEHDDPSDCDGPIMYRAALSGSGLQYPRCDRGYEEYVDRVQPRLDEIRSRYPDSATPPEWFDPTYAGETWDDEG